MATLSHCGIYPFHSIQHGCWSLFWVNLFISVWVIFPNKYNAQLVEAKTQPKKEKKKYWNKTKRITATMLWPFLIIGFFRSYKWAWGWQPRLYRQGREVKLFIDTPTCHWFLVFSWNLLTTLVLSFNIVDCAPVSVPSSPMENSPEESCMPSYELLSAQINDQQ